METLLRVLAALPLAWVHRLGTLAGWLTYGGSPTYRRRFRAQVAQAGVAPADARAAVGAAGRMVAELPRLWRHGVAGVPLRCEGTALVDAAVAAGRGIVFLTPHLGCFEITAQAYAARWGDRQPITVLYRPARQAWLRAWVSGARDRPGLTAVPADLSGVRGMLRALRRGQAVGLLPDQVPPEGMGVWAPFFGRPAYTMTLAARLVQQSGAQPILVWGERLPGGAGYVVRFEAFDEVLPAEVEAQAESAAAVNRAMERLIRACPGQYLWGYHRYKAPRQAGPAPAAAAAAAPPAD
ncbi:lysophospholipid acyltransferase family protein [Piscinibacter sakaiensis]|uniref:Lipid A biosynthesis lauroyl acyltransferase n=1 Tax=Piscinibacter sakaiensis TaxID=1547922 RepID=A0A0K8P8R3_PISS1|nr:lysophospholipid acyltransferase family protein [Piscinibacter sakaiensis]GAP38580.1 lipid A biosynthesis lauroyl acyltransferase [Piscinibacter sakaiensis]